MNTAQNDLRTWLPAVRWVARISSIPIILVFILMFVGEGFDPGAVKPREWIMLLFGPFGLILGMILGWWKDGLGGTLTLVSYLGAMIVGGYSPSGAGYMLVCAAPGILFLLSWFLSKLAARTPETIQGESQPVAPAEQQVTK